MLERRQRHVLVHDRNVEVRRELEDPLADRIVALVPTKQRGLLYGVDEFVMGDISGPDPPRRVCEKCDDRELDD